MSRSGFPARTGYRPKRSALDAAAACRERCWKKDWAIDLDVRKFFDTVPWSLVVKAVEAVTDTPWVLLYVKRWLAAPLQLRDEPAWVSRRLHTLEARMESWTSEHHQSGTRMS